MCDLDKEEKVLITWVLKTGYKEQQAVKEAKNRRACRWKRPLVGMLKLNTDAGKSCRGGTGLGCICRDWNGEVVFAAAKHEDVRWNADIAEGRAILFGLQEACNRRTSPLIVETDCKKIVDLLLSNGNCRTELGSICRDVKEYAEKGDVRGWNFVFREANRVAHTLAHNESFSHNTMVWTGVLPGEIAEIVASEANH